MRMYFELIKIEGQKKRKKKKRRAELLSLIEENHLVEHCNSVLYFPVLGSINEKVPQREGAGKAGNYLEMNLHND